MRINGPGSTMKRVQAILFDMDGVIVDSMKIHADSWKTVLSEYRLTLENIDIFRREGMSGRASVEDIFRERGVPVPDEIEFDRLMLRKHELFESHMPVVYPLIKTMIEYVKSRDVAIGLVTGSLKRSVVHVLPDGILTAFDSIISADDVVNGKPDPEPYLKCLESLNRGRDEALVIENAPMGIRSAKGAGLYCVALETTLPAGYLAGADMVLSDHMELYRYLREILP